MCVCGDLNRQRRVPSGKLSVVANPASDSHDENHDENVTRTSLPFQAKSFNQDISAWDTSSVTSLHSTFQRASSFNQDISAWDVSSVVDMHTTFQYAASFNQDISAWDVSSVTLFTEMFQFATVFDQGLAWDTRRAINCEKMFNEASAFSQGGWSDSIPSTNVPHYLPLSPAVPHGLLRTARVNFADFPHRHPKCCVGTFRAQSTQRTCFWAAMALSAAVSSKT